MRLIKICPECGLEFEATNGMQKFCKRQHFRKCVVCGEVFEVTAYHLTAKDARVTCSKKCTTELRKQTNMQKYGGAAPASSSDVRAKMEATNLERYGVLHAAQSKEIQAKMKATNQDRYGCSWYTQTDEWADKVRETSEKLYGTAWPTQSSVVQQHTIDTSIRRYGVEYPMQCPDISLKFTQSHMSDPNKLSEFVAFRSDVADYIEKLALDHKPTLYELSRIVGVNTSTIGVFVHEQHCEDLVAFQISVMEQEVCDFIKSVVDTDIQMNVHDMITPNELDIYLPEYKLAIECNPTATHNTTVNVFDGGPSTIYPGYHLMKTKKCEASDIFLFHIFGSEWKYKRPVLESMLRNLLGVCIRRIYARQCKICEISASECRMFLDANHRQGNVNSPIRLGLYFKDELVSVMTFSKVRYTIGTDGTDLSDCYELVRFCSALNTSVVGGASKLFKHFIQKYQPSRIRSFSDRARTKGALYSTLGFVRIRESDPGYVWVNSKTDVSYHRYVAQKHSIKKFLHDDKLDLSKTEKQLMEEHGFLQVFDCGTILWEWVNNENRYIH